MHKVFLRTKWGIFFGPPCIFPIWNSRQSIIYAKIVDFGTRPLKSVSVNVWVRTRSELTYSLSYTLTRCGLIKKIGKVTGASCKRESVITDWGEKTITAFNLLITWHEHEWDHECCWLWCWRVSVSVSLWPLTKVKKITAFNLPMTWCDRERESVSVSVIVSDADNVLVM